MIIFFTLMKKKSTQYFIKILKEIKCLVSIKGNTENKLKALKIAEELADKSTLPILRKGLRDISPEVIKISAFL